MPHPKTNPDKIFIPKLFKEGGVEAITNANVVTNPESSIEIHFLFHLW